MRGCTDPLALDPFSPIGISPTGEIASTTEPLALESLSPPAAHTPTPSTAARSRTPPGAVDPRLEATHCCDGRRAA
jgi:hypothetical protein